MHRLGSTTTAAVLLVLGGMAATAAAGAPAAQTKPTSTASSDAGTENKPAPANKHTYTYKKVDDCEIRADVYRPSADSARTPVIIWIHGGALIMGSRASINRLQLDLYLRAGYTVVAIDYRLAPETKLPGILDDLRDAFAWVREEGPTLFHIDPERVAVIGHSAGGYLTQMSGWCITPRSKALVSFCGYGDIIGDWYTKPSPTYSKQPAVTREQAYSCVGTTAVSEPKSDRVPFYLYTRQQGIWPNVVTGLDPKQQPAAFAAFCPLRNVSADYPPILLLHGSKDSDVPYEQSVLMDTELSRFKVAHELVTIEGEHGFDSDMRNPRIQKVFDRVLAFLKQHL
ncbi:MAG TPA: alpha/beta hydrolase [Phycisphaerae bacterium]|nr:alpha/beta hydrolase [Phycisphaerae bacterium]HRR86267.1 alpha/beta hydrolase [Phycisphaerae bacterium]